MGSLAFMPTRRRLLAICKIPSTLAAPVFFYPVKNNLAPTGPPCFAASRLSFESPNPHSPNPLSPEARDSLNSRFRPSPPRQRGRPD